MLVFKLFISQPTFNTIQLKKAKKLILSLVGNQRVYLNPLYGAFLTIIKYFGYKIGIQFNNTPLVVEQNSYSTKTVNAFIVKFCFKKIACLVRLT